MWSVSFLTSTFTVVLLCPCGPKHSILWGRQGSTSEAGLCHTPIPMQTYTGHPCDLRKEPDSVSHWPLARPALRRLHCKPQPLQQSELPMALQCRVPAASSQTHVSHCLQSGFLSRTFCFPTTDPQTGAQFQKRWNGKLARNSELMILLMAGQRANQEGLQHGASQGFLILEQFPCRQC